MTYILLAKNKKNTKGDKNGKQINGSKVLGC